MYLASMEPEPKLNRSSEKEYTGDQIVQHTGKTKLLLCKEIVLLSVRAW